MWLLDFLYPSHLIPIIHIITTHYWGYDSDGVTINNSCFIHERNDAALDDFFASFFLFFGVFLSNNVWTRSPSNNDQSFNLKPALLRSGVASFLFLALVLLFRSTGIQLTARIYNTFQTSFVLQLVALNFLFQVTYDGDYESSILSLQHRSFNHPQSSKCEGAVRLRKSCLFLSFFWLYNMPIFLITNIDHGGHRPRPRRVGPDMVDQ